MKSKVEEEVLRDRAEVQTPIIFRNWQGDDAILGVPPTSPRKGLEGSDSKTASSKSGSGSSSKRLGGKK
jgi:hypothetical protein